MKLNIMRRLYAVIQVMKKCFNLIKAGDEDKQILVKQQNISIHISTRVCIQRLEEWLSRQSF